MIYLLGGYLFLFVHRPFEVWPSLGPLQIERAYMLVLVLAWLASPKTLVPNRVHAALAFFALVVGVTWVLSPYTDVPGVTLVVENYFKVAVFYVLVVTTVRDEKGLRQLLLMVLAVNALYVTHSLLAFIGGRYQYRMGTPRMMGIDISFADPNAFGATLLYTLPMSLPFWAERSFGGSRRGLPFWLLLGCTLMVCCCILLTGSRSAFLGLCLYGAIVLWLTFERKLALVAFGSVAVVFLLGLASVALPGELRDRYLTIIDPSVGPVNAQESAMGRVVGFTKGIEVWQKSPLVGHGPGSFAHSTGIGFGAHNIYGQVLSEMGVVGAVAMLGLWVALALNWFEMRSLVRQNPWLWPAGLVPTQLAGPARQAGLPPPDFAYHACRGVTIAAVLLLLMGFAGHNLFRYQWQWFAAFQAIALHCVRMKVAAVRAGAVPLPDLTTPVLARSMIGW